MRREWWLACSSSSRLMSFSSSSLPFLLEEVVVKSEIKGKLSKFKKKYPKKRRQNFLRVETTQTKTFESERASERARAQCSASNITRRQRRRS